MDSKDSSIPEPSPEVRIDLSLEDMATDQACQDSCKTTRDCNEESNPMAPQPSEIQGDSNHAEPLPDRNEESNPMAPQPSEIQGDSNPAKPPPDYNEESNPMVPQPSEIQGDLNPAKPPPDCNEESNPMTPQPNEIQGDLNPAETPPVQIGLAVGCTTKQFRQEWTAKQTEVCMDLSSKDVATDQACQDNCKTTIEVHEEGSSQGVATDKASQDSSNTMREVHEERSSKGITTDKASQDGRNTSRGNKEVPAKESSEVSSEVMTTDKASDDDHGATRELHKEGSSEEMVNLREDFDAWVEKLSMMLESETEVMPKAVVNKDNRSLFEAALKGEWRDIEKILNEDDAAMTAKVMTIGSDDLTMLDVAIMAAQDQLVEKLVKYLPPKCEGLNPSRAMCCAAGGGSVRMVKALLDKIGAESTIIGDALEFVCTRTSPSQKEVIWYLARHITSAPTSEIMIGLIMDGHLDTCLYLARKYPNSMPFEDTEEVMVLALLAIMTRYFRSGARLNFWEKLIYKIIPLCLVDTSFDDSKNTKMAQALLVLTRIKIALWNLATIPAFIKRSGELKLRHSCSLNLAKLALMKMMENMDAAMIVKTLLTSGTVVDAASRGVMEIVELCLKYFPELMWDENFAIELIKEIVKGRHVELFRLVNAHNPSQCLAMLRLDNNSLTKVSLMAAVANWSPRCVSPDVSGAAFLLQRELQWFQVVEVSRSPYVRWLKIQVHKKTYWEVFVDQRRKLHKEAQQWMKDTSSSCSLVATLIFTIAFAAAFTVPGGNDSSKGIPIFLENNSFMVFAIADALALFCSVTATLMFLAILTSRYAIEDFLYSLPRKMILGLTFLFLSLAFMLVAFGSTLTIVLSKRLNWTYIPITLLAALPVALFAILQLPLYIEMVESTFWPRLYRPWKLWR